MKQQIVQLSFILTFLALASSTFAQEKTQIPNTNLHIELTTGFELGKEENTIITKDYCMTFMEMADFDFEKEKSDFDDIETQYLAKNIVVEKKETKQIGNYKAIVISLQTTPDMFQFFLGNQEFCAFINVIANDSIQINEQEVETFLQTLEYIPSTKNAMEEHAKFRFIDDNHDWKFASYNMNIFGFENIKTEDFFMITQLPKATVTASNEELANQVLNSFKSKFEACNIIKSEPWKTENLDGHRVLVEIINDGEMSLFLYLFVFDNNENTFLFQGMSQKNETIKVTLFESTIKNLTFKN